MIAFRLLLLQCAADATDLFGPAEEDLGKLVLHANDPGIPPEEKDLAWRLFRAVEVVEMQLAKDDIDPSEGPTPAEVDIVGAQIVARMTYIAEVETNQGKPWPPEIRQALTEALYAQMAGLLGAHKVVLAG